ncbi:MAG: hypothetical protein R2838_05910 [Caldilineaceae bacterium]
MVIAPRCVRGARAQRRPCRLNGGVTLAYVYSGVSLSETTRSCCAPNREEADRVVWGDDWHTLERVSPWQTAATSPG